MFFYKCDDDGNIIQRLRTGLDMTVMSDLKFSTDQGDMFNKRFDNVNQELLTLDANGDVDVAINPIPVDDENVA